MNWLMLRGLIREQRHWMEFPEVLRQKRPGDKTFTMDAPGLGTERNRDSPTSIRGIMEDMRGRWLKLRDENPGEWRILCISLGGMVGLSWVDAHPEDFTRLVVINSSAGNLNAFYERMRWKAIPRVLRIPFMADHTAREREVLAITCNMRSDLDTIASAWAKYSAESPVRLPVAFQQLYAATTFRAPKSVKVPVLILSGAGDNLVSPVCSQTLAKRYGGNLKVHPTAGHDLPLDDGDWVAAQIESW